MPYAIAFVVDSVLFTKAVIAGETSLGGSESACLGLARALKARGHDIHLFTTQIEAAAVGPDAFGVMWHRYDEFQAMNAFIEWDVVCSLRMFGVFNQPVAARLRLLWTQDLLVPGPMQGGVMSVAWAYDQVIYVSEYHRQQWEDLQPELKGIGAVTRNGYDPRDLPPKPRTKDPHRIIHISRPERGLESLLKMWPKLRAQIPDATLQICRYNSMYDAGPGGWAEVCHTFDRKVEQVNAQVGGITYLGELSKPALYRAISDAAVMWYPGVAGFAETSCCAAVEAAACGTPFVGSLKGALPETARPSYDAGLLIPGDAMKDDAYQDASIAAVIGLLDGCARQTFAYRALQRAGLRHVERYTYDVLAAQLETQIDQWFTERYKSHKLGILRQLLHEDDHIAAKLLASDMEAAVHAQREQACQLGERRPSVVNLIGHVDPEKPETGLCREVLHCETCEAIRAHDFCDYVIAGKDHSAEHYGNAAIQDPLQEVSSPRFQMVTPLFEDCTNVLDVACGNGSFAIALARAHPKVHVYGLDFAAHNIEIANEAAARAGVSTRCHFSALTVYDFDAQTMHADWLDYRADMLGEPFDGLFVGEFVEHVGDCTKLIDALETVLADGARVVYTCPHGACAELVLRGTPLRRGHVHRFHHDDLKAVWGGKLDFRADFLQGGFTPRGTVIGNWVIQYRVAPNRPAGIRPLAERIRRTRPLQKLSVGLIVKDVENDLGRCLASIYQIADEIVIGDTGSTDTTKAIAASYGARILDLPSIFDYRDGFSGARNAVLTACTGDWFQWIDADEQLINAPWLRRYLEGRVYNGFVIHQTHLYMDGPSTFDIPVRVFRHTGRVKFYGTIHEQPQDGDCNGDIFPTLDVTDIQLAHTGYLTAEGREDKRLARNLPLLIRDAQMFPDRVLGKVLLIRESVIQADRHCGPNGELTDVAARGYAQAVQLFRTYFLDPAHKYHQIARPWYQAALRHLGLGYEMEVAFAGKQGPMNGNHAKPERIWVADGAEFALLMAHQVDLLAQKMKPTTFKTDPFVLPPVREEATA